MVQKEPQTPEPLLWLLEPESPGVRYLAMRDLVQLPEDDPELGEARRIAHTTGPIAAILAAMDPAGYWTEPGPGYNPKYRSTVWSILLLAQLGALAGQDERIDRACAYLLDHALAQGGQFSTSGAPSGTVDCLQGNLCWALTEIGYSDTRLEKAYEWMARTVTGEGMAPVGERQATLRYYSAKCGLLFACGANNKMPCAWGAVKVLLAFSHCPPAYHTPLVKEAIARGVEFLFSIDPATANYPAGYSSHPSQSWWRFGFPLFYVTDLLQLAEVLASLGYGQDPRLRHVMALIVEKRDAQGRWRLEYNYHGKTWVDLGDKNQADKYVTLRALRVLKMAGVEGGELRI
jgi:hypothetical protein